MKKILLFTLYSSIGIIILIALYGNFLTMQKQSIEDKKNPEEKFKDNLIGTWQDNANPFLNSELIFSPG